MKRGEELELKTGSVRTRTIPINFFNTCIALVATTVSTYKTDTILGVVLQTVVYFFRSFLNAK